ncbi:hypothetical protein [Mesobacillus stamsii]|uniref:Uncharacterized protein n=1 Tax=Mesobacillus stamsii TaxID=225347 RepID=A0ABU0FWB5_9BACI|nr:hypothetical protein [Mesobacillus stamsii]MDQ0414216.1 hypothetical protein [Mesobacillus stamsii]
MIGKVTTRYMTEEERLAYIKKYPIVPKERPKGSTFVSLEPVTFVNNKKKMANSKQNEK